MEVIYPADEPEAVYLARLQRSRISGKTEAELHIEEPDLILAPRACALFYKLNKIYKMTSAVDAEGNIYRTTHRQLLLDALETLAGSFDKVVIIFEAFEPSNPFAGLPNQSPRNAASDRAVESFQKQIAERRTIQQNIHPFIDVEILFADSALEAARMIRSRLDREYASDSMMGHLAFVSI